MTALTERGILDILKHPLDEPWTIQGFGMLRLYLADDQISRLHIWDTEEMAVEDVTRTHDHPWDFTSRIVSGSLTNLRFNYGTIYSGADHWAGMVIKTGEDAKGLADPEDFWLDPSEPEHYVPGDVYHQDAPEIHESMPSRGAVTLVERTFSRERDRATVFFRKGDSWVDARVKPATKAEIMHFTRLALIRWQS